MLQIKLLKLLADLDVVAVDGSSSNEEEQQYSNGEQQTIITERKMEANEMCQLPKEEGL